MTIDRRPAARGVLLGIAAVMLIACGETPSEGYSSVLAMSKRGDWGGVYDRLDKKSQGRLDVALEIASDERGTSGRALFVGLAPSQAALRSRFDPDVQVLSAKVDGDRATLLVRPSTRADHEQVVSMLKEDGVWKLSIDALELGPIEVASASPRAGVGAAPGRTTLETECGKLIYVFTMGARSIRAFPREGDDPVASLTRLADTIDRISADVARVPLTVPELRAASADFQGMTREEAKAARDMARAVETRDVRRADAAKATMDRVSKREGPIVEGVHQFCGM